jgi:hypothetical protein
MQRAGELGVVLLLLLLLLLLLPLSEMAGSAAPGGVCCWAPRGRCSLAPASAVAVANARPVCEGTKARLRDGWCGAERGANAPAMGGESSRCRASGAAAAAAFAALQPLPAIDAWRDSAMMDANLRPPLPADIGNSWFLAGGWCRQGCRRKIATFSVVCSETELSIRVLTFLRRGRSYCDGMRRGNRLHERPVAPRRHPSSVHRAALFRRICCRPALASSGIGQTHVQLQI